ncbi:MAG: hypothetical protein EXR80_08430 [Methylococcales bacterium]|nr:hypothetical protein [Methylococcales bacterium]
MLLCYSVQAKSITTITCNEPEGNRTDFYESEFKEINDGFAGVTPKIVFDNNKAKQVTVFFEPADIAKKTGISNPITVFNIVAQNADKISIIGQPNPNGVHLYSLFPKLGMGYFTIHRYNNINKVEASTATLIAKCNVTP